MVDLNICKSSRGKYTTNSGVACIFISQWSKREGKGRREGGERTDKTGEFGGHFVKMTSTRSQECAHTVVRRSIGVYSLKGM